MWVNIDGYATPARINEHGTVQTFYRGKWRDKKRQSQDKLIDRFVYFSGLDGKRKKRYIGSLMADAFFGGPKPGYAIVHKNGMGTDFELENLSYEPRKGQPGRCGENRRPVAAINMAGRIVKIYASVSEASRREHISPRRIRVYCNQPLPVLSPKTGRRYRFMSDVEKDVESVER